ncbi:MAG: J domain-containing protein [Chloroflexi bacterium]|nr:J domain-containing protein [Chloroflexota bacterium]
MTTDASGKPGSQGKGAERREPAIDLYELLEVSPRASEQVIQAAYRVLARQNHPDVNPELSGAAAERRIRALNAAYQVLSDSRARARYDHERSAARRVERMTGAERTSRTVAEVNGHVSGHASRARALSTRSAIAVTDDRFPALRAGTALLLLLVAGLIVLLLLLAWSALDPTRDYVSDYAPQVVVAGR